VQQHNEKLVLKCKIDHSQYNVHHHRISSGAILSNVAEAHSLHWCDPS